MSVRWGRCCIAAWSAALALSAPLRAQEGASSQQSLERARSEAAAGRLAEAERVLREHLRLHPEDLEVGTQLATVLGWEHRYDEAVAQADRTLQLAPRDLDALAAAARALLWSNRPSRALEYLDRGLAFSPTDAGLLKLRAQAREALNQPPPTARPWTVSGTLTLDRYQTVDLTWVELTGRAVRRTDWGAGVVGVAHAERSGERDDQLQLEAYPKLWPRAYGHLFVGAAPRAKLYPSVALSAEVYQGLPAGLSAWGGYRYLSFSPSVHLLEGGGTFTTGRITALGALYLSLPERQPTGQLGLRYSFDEVTFIGLRGTLGAARPDLHSQASLGSQHVKGLQLEGQTLLAGQWELGLHAGAFWEDLFGLQGLLHLQATLDAGVRF